MQDSKPGCHCGSCKQRKRMCKKKLSWNLHTSQEIPKVDQVYHKEKRKMLQKIMSYQYTCVNQIYVDPNQIKTFFHITQIP